MLRVEAVTGVASPADNRSNHIKDEAMTYHCSECVVNWWPYQCAEGRCPECGGGTSRSREPISDDADARHRAVLAGAVKRDRYARFEAYYAEREQRRTAA